MGATLSWAWQNLWVRVVAYVALLVLAFALLSWVFNGARAAVGIVLTAFLFSYVVSPDGRHLKGSARGGVGDKAIALVLAHLRRWGLLRPRPGFPGRGPDGPGCPANRGHHFLHRKDSQAELKDGAARRTMCAATTRYLESAKKPIVNHQELSAITESRRPVSENPSAFR